MLPILSHSEHSSPNNCSKIRTLAEAYCLHNIQLIASRLSNDKAKSHARKVRWVLLKKIVFTHIHHAQNRDQNG